MSSPFSATHAALAVISCHATPPVLDTMPRICDAFVARIAPDERMLLGPDRHRDAILHGAREYLEGVEPSALVVDQSDAWSVTTIPAVSLDVLRQLSVVRLPEARPAFYQGIVAGVPAKVLLDTDGAHVLVPSPVGHHFASRLRDVGLDDA